MWNMKSVYEVIVPFKQLVYESMGSKVSTELPPNPTFLDEIIIVEKDNFWELNFDVDAENVLIAREKAVQIAEVVLSLFAINNDGFRVLESGVRSKKKEPVKVKITKSGNRTHVSFELEINLTDHVSAVKTKGNLELEASYFSIKESWPLYLSNALNLNYLSVMSHKPAIKFILIVSALESLTYGRLGSIKSIIKTELSNEIYKTFIEKLISFLDDYDFSSKEFKDRIKKHCLNTTTHSIPNHIITYLGTMDIKEYTLGDVKLWWKLRSDLSHGKKVKKEELYFEFGKLLQATQRAIRSEFIDLTTD